MRFIILMVIVTAAVAAGLGILWISGGHNAGAPPLPLAALPQNPSEVATVDVLVARTDIPVGTVLSADMIDRQPWPKHLVLEGFITADSPDANVVGEVTRSDFRARQPILKTELSNGQGAGFLAASLGKGMRAVTLGVDSVAGVAGYIFPGDHVDVIITHNLDQEGDGGGSAAAPGMPGLSGLTALSGISAPPGAGGGGQQGATTSEVLLPNAKVLEVGVHKAEPEASGIASRFGMAQAAQSMGGDITLELSQEDAKKLRLAERNGSLSLALRSVQDMKDNDVGEPVTLSDLTRANGPVHVKSVQLPSSDVIITRGPPQ